MYSSIHVLLLKIISQNMKNVISSLAQYSLFFLHFFIFPCPTKINKFTNPKIISNNHFSLFIPWSNQQRFRCIFMSVFQESAYHEAVFGLYPPQAERATKDLDCLSCLGHLYTYFPLDYMCFHLIHRPILKYFHFINVYIFFYASNVCRIFLCLTGHSAASRNAKMSRIMTQWPMRLGEKLYKDSVLHILDLQ